LGVNRLSTRNKEGSPKKTAIIAGINSYEAPKIDTLAGAENDANEICERLQNNGDFDISKGHFLIGQDATRKNILRAISEVFRRDATYDVVALYFSGHGVLDRQNVGYIAPYDMDPEDPFVSGISMEQLRTVIYESKNDASVVMLLDCCHAGVAAQDTQRDGPVTTTVTDTNKDLITTEFKKIVESPSQQGTQVSGTRGAVILASSEAKAVSRERDYVHSDDGKTHRHGAFTFHLLEGIDGKAADNSGVITIGSLRKYVEDKMQKEDRQLPVYSVAGASRIDSIHVAISQNRFRATVEELISDAQGLLVVKYPNTDIIDFQYLTLAAKKVSKLASLEPNNEKLPTLYSVINDGAAWFRQPTLEWLVKNSEYAKPKLYKIDPILYDDKIPEMVQNLSYDELQKLDQTRSRTLNTLLAEVARNREFTAEDDPNLENLYIKLRAALRNNFDISKQIATNR